MKPSNKTNRAYWLWGAAAVAVLFLAFGGLAFRTYTNRDRVPDLLAQAYTDARPFEWRLPDHGYAAIQKRKPATLLEAQGLIARKLEGVSDPGPALLAQRAWADLLDTNPDAAIRSLDLARKADPDNLTLLSLLGTAHALRADAAGFSTALEFYSRVLRQDPGNPLALFNRALVYSKIKAYPMAIADCREFEKLAADAKWSEEIGTLRKQAEQAITAGKP